MAHRSIYVRTADLSSPLGRSDTGSARPAWRRFFIEPSSPGRKATATAPNQSGGMSGRMLNCSSRSPRQRCLSSAGDAYNADKPHSSPGDRSPASEVILRPAPTLRFAPVSPRAGGYCGIPILELVSLNWAGERPARVVGRRRHPARNSTAVIAATTQARIQGKKAPESTNSVSVERDCGRAGGRPPAEAEPI